MYSVGAISNRFNSVLSMVLLLLCVDYNPFLVLIMWPFSVAVGRVNVC